MWIDFSFNKIILVLIFLLQPLILTAEQLLDLNLNYLRCRFCTPIPADPDSNWSQNTFTEKISTEDMASILQFINTNDSWSAPAESSYQRLNRVRKTLLLYKDTHLLLNAIRRFRNSIRYYAWTIPLEDDDNREHFVSLLTSSFLRNLAPLQVGGYYELLQVSKWSLPFFEFLKRSGDIIEKYAESPTQKYDLFREVLKFTKELFSIRQNFIKDFDLISYEIDFLRSVDDYNNNLEYVNNLVNFSASQLQRNYLVRGVRDQLEADKDQLPPYLYRDLMSYVDQRYDEFTALTESSREKLKQLETKMISYELLEEIKKAFTIFKVVADIIDASTDLNAEQQKLAEEIDSFRNPLPEVSKQTLLKVEEITTRIWSAFPQYKVITTYYKSLSDTEAAGQPTCPSMSYTSCINQMLVKDKVVDGRKYDQFLSRHQVSFDLENIFYYLASENNFKFDDFSNPPFVACTKLLDKFEGSLNSDSYKKDYWQTRIGIPTQQGILKAYERLGEPGQNDFKNRARRFSFINKCTHKVAAIHYFSLLIANDVYKVKFTNKQGAPSYEIPENLASLNHFEASKVYGHNKKACSSTGFKAFRAKINKSYYNAMFFGITGTEVVEDGTSESFYRKKIGGRLDDIATDIFFGIPQLETPCARELINDAVFFALKGKDIVISGHSLGGGLAQALGYLIEKELQKYTNTPGQVYVVSWNGFGAYQTLKSYLRKSSNYQDKGELDQKIIDNIFGVAYFMKNDVVSKVGTHIFETRELSPLITDSYLKGIEEHRLSSIEKSSVRKSYGMLGITTPSVPEPSSVIQKVGDGWFNITEWYREKVAAP